MRTLPLVDPGEPDLGSPARFLLRIARLQARTVAGGVVFGVLWMGGQALVPFALGRAIDVGIAGEDRAGLVRWALVLAAIGAVQTVSGITRHRFAVANFLVAYFRTVQWVDDQALRLGSSLRSRSSTGEVVSAVTNDALAVARALDLTARGTGAVVAFALVTVLLVASSPALGLVVVAGVPLFTLAVGALLRPLHARQGAQRTELGRLTTLGADTVAGLRVLRGIGGEQEFLTRYRHASQQVRTSGRDVAATQALLDAAQVLVPGTFVVVVTWLGARLAVDGTLSVGELVTFYGYAAFLVTPLRTFTEAGDKFTRALVGGRRLIALLALTPVLTDAGTAAEPPTGSVLEDENSCLSVEPGVLTAVVSPDPAIGSQLAERLGRYVDDGVVRLGATPLTDLPMATVRRRIMVLDQSPQLFGGRLAGELAGPGELAAALHAASAEDVLDALPAGLDSVLDERGRQLSGGQRQRLALARALTADAEILILDEPTSAVDAHTEQAIADRLAAVRAGRTTVVLTTSPLLLERADRVVLLQDGRVHATGTHRSLLADPAYRAVVARDQAITTSLAEPAAGPATEPAGDMRPAVGSRP